MLSFYFVILFAVFGFSTELVNPSQSLQSTKTTIAAEKCNNDLFSGIS